MSQTDESDPERRTQRRSMLKLWGFSLLATAALFALAFTLMGPAPPTHLVLAAGAEDGAYHRRALAYRGLLAEDGIEVEVRTTAGSVENLALLTSGEVDVAFVQGGTATKADRKTLRTMASVFFEPLWIFVRRERKVSGLATLRGLRVAIGPEGSGTRSLATRVLEATGGLADEGPGEPAAVLPLGGSEAARALLDGRVDAAFFVVAPGAPYLHDLLASPEVDLLTMPRQDALVRRHPFLAKVYIPQGLFDLVENVPAKDHHVLAPTAALVGRLDQHPAVAPLFIEAARTAHAQGDLLSAPGSFPSSQHVDLPLSDDARRYFEQGPSWLYRVFPFSLASFLDRAIFLLLPLITLLFPLLKTAPPLYRWGVRRRIYRWYRGVREADSALKPGTPETALRAHLASLGQIEREVGRVSIPLSYMQEFYNLRLHLDFVTRKLRRRLGEAPSAETP